MQLFRNESQTLIRAFQYIRNRGGYAEVSPLMRKVLNLHGRPPKKIDEIAREIFSALPDFIELEEGLWGFKYLPVFEEAYERENFVAVDIEATGGKPPVEKIVEIGAVKSRNGEEIEEFSYLINPEKPIQPFVAKMTGIDDKLLRNAHPIEWVMSRFLEFINNQVLILHDPFPDMAFIDDAAMRCFGGVIYNPIIDTLALAKDKLGLHAGLNLSKIAERLEIEQIDEHRALSDAHTTLKAYYTLRAMHDIEVEKDT